MVITLGLFEIQKMIRKKMLLVAFLLTATLAKAQSISGIVLSVDTSTTTGSCPHKIKFNAVIASAGQLRSVNLRWDKSDGTIVSQSNVTLAGKGNDMVSYEWLVNSNFNGTLILNVNTAALRKSSNTIHFKSKCK